MHTHTCIYIYINLDTCVHTQYTYKNSNKIKQTRASSIYIYTYILAFYQGSGDPPMAKWWFGLLFFSGSWAPGSPYCYPNHQ